MYKIVAMFFILSVFGMGAVVVERKEAIETQTLLTAFIVLLLAQLLNAASEILHELREQKKDRMH